MSCNIDNISQTPVKGRVVNSRGHIINIVAFSCGLGKAACRIFANITTGRQQVLNVACSHGDPTQSSLQTDTMENFQILGESQRKVGGKG